MKKTLGGKTNIVVACSFLACLLFSSSAFAANTATITTSGLITLNVAANGSSDSTAIGMDNVTAMTTCRSGYTLDIASSSSDSNLYLNGDSANNTSSYTVISPLSETSTLSTNNWGYSTTNSAISGNFTGLFDTFTTIKTSNSATQVAGELVPVYYGVKVSNTATPGAYAMPNSGAIIYTLTMNPACYEVDIIYDGNNATAGTMGAVHANVREGDTVNLVASNYSKTGYGFAGWSTDPNAGAKLVDNNNTNNPIVYGPQETVTIPDGFLDYDTDNDGIVKLYAVWIPAEKDNNNNPIYLQGWSGCANMDTATYDSTTGALDITKRNITALTDMRDNEVYTIARLADGNCWMVENLRLEAEGTVGNNMNDSTVRNEVLSQGYGDSFTGLANSEESALFGSTTANSLYSTDGSTANTILGSNQVYRFPRYNSSVSNRPQNPTDDYQNMFSYGNYYTWAAAIADTTHYASGDHGTTSICPAGWRLPIGAQSTTDKSFGNLSVSLGGPAGGAMADYSSTPTGVVMSHIFRSYPNNFLYSGSFSNSLTTYMGSDGYYWSSTAINNNGSNLLYLDYPSVYFGTASGVKHYGNSIRCVVSNPGTYTLTYNANGGSGVPASQTTTANGLATFTLSSIIPTRSGFTFAGWTDERGNEGQAGGAFRTNNSNTTLYAIWSNDGCNPTATTIGTGNTSTDAVCLQDVKPSMKASLPLANASTGTYNLIDARDNQSYSIAKLADGNVWLTKNLNYGSNSDMILTSHDTDLPSDKTFLAPASTTAFETANNDTTYISPKILTDSTYGGYYSFAAAIASVNTYNSTGAIIGTSICPKGWDLPTSVQYDNLRVTSGNTTYTTMHAVPYSFRYSGYRNGTSFSSRSSAIRLWTSSNYSSSYAFYATAYGTAGYSGNYKRYGESIRCIASNGNTTIHYNANGGSGTMSDQIGEINSMVVKTNSFNSPNDHKQFKEWNTQADGNGISIAPKASIDSIGISDGQTLNLYAIWDDVYILTFLNTASGSYNALTKNVVVGQSDTVSPSSYWYRSGYKIIGWDVVTNDGSDDAGTVVYTDRQSITPSSDMTFYTVWRPTYTISYNINGGDAGAMGDKTDVAETDQITLLAPNFSRSGYGFAGWSTSSNAATNSSAKIYGPSETISAPAKPASGTLILYAVWVPSAGYFQNASTVQSVCNSLTQAPTNGTANITSVSALTDQRDNETYAIAKLADGNCWMIENLRLEAGGTVGNNTIDPTVTNASLSQGYHSSFTGLANSEALSLFASVTTENSLYTTGTVSGKNTISGSYQSSRFPRYNSSISNRAQNPTENYQNMFSYGNYYTWAAAIADTSDYSMGNYSATSICPAGSRLPIGGNTTDDKSFGNLSVSLGGPAGGDFANSSSTPTGVVMSNRFRSYPNNFVYSGFAYTGSISNRSYAGYYWSSRSSDGGSVVDMNLTSSEVYPGTYYINKYYGESIRCVIDDNITTGSGYIGYYPNAGNVKGTMGKQVIASSDTSAVLLASNFSKEGYGFAGWSDVPDYETNANAHFYGPQETITFTAGQYTGQNNGLSLYAVWVESEGYFQDSTKVSQLCGTGSGSLTQAPTNGTANLSSVSALTDKRDGETYAIAKLADGNCWMIENLRLEAEGTVGNNTIDPTVTNASLSQSYNSNFTGLATAEAPSIFVGSSVANSLYSTDGSTVNTISGTYTSYRFPRYNNYNTPTLANVADRPQNPTTNDSINSTSDAGMYSYGNYYSWPAAMANTSNLLNSSDYGTTSICPTGWRLPIGGPNTTNKGFGKLSVSLGGPSSGFPATDSSTPTGTVMSNRFRSYPNNFVYSGNIHSEASNNSISDRGSNGYYWSSTVSASESSQLLKVGNSVVYPGSISSQKYDGGSIRCVIGS